MVSARKHFYYDQYYPVSVTLQTVTEIQTHCRRYSTRNFADSHINGQCHSERQCVNFNCIFLFWICVTEQYATQTSFVATTSISSSSSKVSVTVGAIVGGVVGAVVLLGVVAGFIWYKIRTRRPTMPLLSETGKDQ